MKPIAFSCAHCGKKYPLQPTRFDCGVCHHVLELQYDYGELNRVNAKEHFLEKQVWHWKYALFYPSMEKKSIVSLHEGGTPLIQSSQRANYFFKFEGSNPTGSFKDRGSSLEVSKAKALGVKKMFCASTGNMGASVSAYCARAGIESTIVVPSHTPSHKINQIQGYGGTVHRVSGTYDDAYQYVERLNEKKRFYLAGDYALRAEGQKSVAFEILDQLSLQALDYIVAPVGNGTLLYSTYKACWEMRRAGIISRMPKIVGVEANGCNPLATAFHQGKLSFKPLKKPDTMASAIDCGNPLFGRQALQCAFDSRGSIESVSDSEMLEAKKELGEREGIYCELSGAASLAAAKKLKLQGTVACVVSGHGLKEG